MEVKRICAWLVAAGIVGGTASYDMRVAPTIVRDGQLVIPADFHIHGAGADGSLSPFGLVLMARHRGLAAIAVTNHNRLLLARVTRSIARKLGGPTVLVGEEITAPGFHLIGMGLTNRVSWNQPLAAAIRDVHAQGGVAIAAHPFIGYWKSFDSAAVAALDGAEVLHPNALASPDAAAQLRAFYDRATAAGGHLAPIASSDYHWKSINALLRTQVFARDQSEGAILEAVRNARTVVFDNAGRAFGDPQLVAALTVDPVPSRTADEHFPDASALDAVTRTCGLVGLIGLFAVRNRKQTRQSTGISTRS